MAEKKSKGGPSARADIDAIGSKLRQACLASVEADVSLMFMDGHDDAIVGVAERDGVSVVVYDSKKVVRRLRARDGMSRDEAEEFYAFNIAGSWHGDMTPIFIRMIVK